MNFISELLFIALEIFIVGGVAYGAFTHQMTFGEIMLCCLLFVFIDRFIDVKYRKGR